MKYLYHIFLKLTNPRQAVDSSRHKKDHHQFRFELFCAFIGHGIFQIIILVGRKQQTPKLERQMLS